MRWFRFYSEALNDLKVQRLSPRLFKHWVNLLCLANENGSRGQLPGDEDVAFALRVSEGDWLNISQALISAGLIDTIESGLGMHGWSARQHESDLDLTATERQRRHRAVTGPLRHTNVTRDVTRESLSPDPDTEQNRSRTDTEKRARPRSKKILTAVLVAELQEAHPDVNVTRLAADLGDYVLQHPRKYTDHPAALRTWIRREEERIDDGTRVAAHSNGFSEPGGLRLGNYEPPGFVLDP